MSPAPVGLLGEVRTNGQSSADDPGVVALVRAALIEPDRVTWAWANRIPAGMASLVAGRGGAGKTVFVAYLGARLTRGQLPGAWYGHPADFVYIGAEDHPASVLVPRFIAAGADLDRVHLLRAPAAWHSGYAAELAAALEPLDVAMLVIDPIDAHLGGVDTHRKAEVQAALASTVETLTKTRRCAVVGLAHISKGDSPDVVKRIIGSVGFTTSARAVLAVGDHPEEPRDRIIVGAKANMAAEGAAPALRFRVETAHVPHPDGGDPIETAAVVILGEEPGIDASAILTVATAEEHSARDRAVEWLADLLGAGPVELREILRAANDDDIARATLFRARDRVGITVTRDESKRGRPATWALSSRPFSSQAQRETGETKSKEPLTSTAAPPNGVSSHGLTSLGDDTEPIHDGARLRGIEGLDA